MAQMSLFSSKSCPLTFMRSINLILLSILAFSTLNSFANEMENTEAETNFTQGQIFYENDEIDNAINEFTLAVNKSPKVSKYHHWLAKAYGELAENSGWFKAMQLAENSRDSLKRAIELDPDNIAALMDLMRFYQQAPIFLGGSDEKAKEIGIRLDILEGKTQVPLNTQQQLYNNLGIEHKNG